MKGSTAFLIAFLGLLGMQSGFAERKLVVVTEVWAPYRISLDGENLSGIDIDIVHALEERLGLAIDIEIHPWPRALEMMRQGEADIMTGIAWSEERNSYISFIPVPYSAVQPVFYSLKGSGVSVSSYSDLSGKRIGQSLKTVYFEPFDTDVALEKVILTAENQILRLLSLGRLDLAVGTDPNISWDIKRLGYSGLFERTSYVPPVKTDLFIGISRKSAALDLADDIERVLRELIACGEIEKIMAKYR